MMKKIVPQIAMEINPKQKWRQPKKSWNKVINIAFAVLEMCMTGVSV